MDYQPDLSSVASMRATTSLLVINDGSQCLWFGIDHGGHDAFPRSGSTRIRGGTDVFDAVLELRR